MLGYAFYNYRPAIHRPAPQPDPVAAEPVAVATPTETPKHVMTHLELVNFVQSHLIATITNRRLEGGYLYVYGTLSNSTNAALRYVEVTVTAYNEQKQVVNDTTLFPAQSGYIQSGQTLKFSTMIRDERGDIYHLEAVVNPVDNTVLNSALFQ